MDNPTSAGEEVKWIPVTERTAPFDEPILADIEYNSSGHPLTERIVCVNRGGELETEVGDDIGWPDEVITRWLPLAALERPASPPSSGPQYTVSDKVTLRPIPGTRGDGYEIVAPASGSQVSSGVAHAEQTDAVSLSERTASNQSGPLESNSVAPPSARPAEPELCANCNEPKSNHRPFVRPEKGKPLGIEPNGWFCQESPCSSRIRTFKPKPAAPSRTGGEDTMQDEFPDFSRKTEYVDEPVAAKSVKPSAPDAGQPVITVSRGAPPGVGEPPWASAPASAAPRARREDFRNWYSRLSDKAYLVKSEFVDQIRREEFDCGATWTTIKRALRFADHWAAEQTRQLREELEQERRADVEIQETVRKYMADAQRAEQRAQAAEAERDRLRTAIKDQRDEVAKSLRLETGNRPNQFFIPAEPSPLGPFFGIVDAVKAWVKFNDEQDAKDRAELDRLRKEAK